MFCEVGFCNVDYFNQYPVGIELINLCGGKWFPSRNYVSANSCPWSLKSRYLAIWYLKHHLPPLKFYSETSLQNFAPSFLGSKPNSANLLRYPRVNLNLKMMGTSSTAETSDWWLRCQNPQCTIITLHSTYSTSTIQHQTYHPASGCICLTTILFGKEQKICAMWHCLELIQISSARKGQFLVQSSQSKDVFAFD